MFISGLRRARIDVKNWGVSYGEDDVRHGLWTGKDADRARPYHAKDSNDHLAGALSRGAPGMGRSVLEVRSKCTEEQLEWQ